MIWYADLVEAENFLSYSRMTWDLRGSPNVTAIIGLNGAGKSTRFAALCWLLYGKTPKAKLPADKVIKRGCDSCTVTGVIRDDNGSVTVTRKRSARGPSLTLSGLTGKDATLEGVQAYIDKRFGDYERFTKTDMFSGDRSSFCRLGDSARKELLESMVGIQHYAVAGEAAKKQCDKVKAESDVWASERERATQDIERLLGERQKYALEALHYARLMNVEYRRLVKVSSEQCDVTRQTYDLLAKWLEEADAERVRVAAERAKHEQSITVLENEMAAIDKKIDALKDSEGKLSTAVARIEDEVARYTTDTHPDICPTCGQAWHQEVDTGAVAKIVADLQAKLLTARRAVAPLAGEIRELRTQKADKERVKVTTGRTIRELESKIDDRAYRTLLANALNSDSRLQAAQQAVIDFENEWEDEYSSEDTIRIDAEIGSARAKHAEARQKVIVSECLMEHLTFWRKGFGRNGLPAWLIDSAVPEMTEVACAIASDLSDGKLTLAFDSSAEKGSGSVFDVKVDYEDGGEGFESVSRGEQMRVDVAVLFAVRDLAAKRSGIECGQLFLDELTDGADEHFLTDFVRMLRKRYADRQVHIVTHDPTALNLCDKVIKVRKTDGVSSVK